MSNQKHTKGPWSSGKNRVATHSDFVIYSENKTIATMTDDYWSRSHNDVPLEQESNAKLIAAAPELLSGLVSAVSRLQVISGNKNFRDQFVFSSDQLCYELEELINNLGVEGD